MATRVSSPLFIGRQQELDRVLDVVVRAATGDAGTILIGGDAGIGKSRLVAEVSARAGAMGSLVLEGGCVSLGDSGGLPFAPIVEALRRLPTIIAQDPDGTLGTLDDLRSPATAELGRLLPELRSTLEPELAAFDRPEWIQARIFEGLLSLLRALSERAPVTLILEDLHWADGSTRDLTSFLARNARTERIAVIGTYRTDELHRRHPLRPWLSEMERLPRVQRLELARFGPVEMLAQVSAILDHAPAAGLVEAIGRRAEGNPFFIEELLASGAEAAGDRLPPTLRDVLLTRVTALSEPAQRILGIAAVAGRTVDLELLAAVAEVPEPGLEGPLREALAAQIVVNDPHRAGASRFRHALLAEAVYDDLLPSERRRLHAAYAAALEARPTPEGAEGASHLSALAHHATAAHEPARALRSWVAAARAATRAAAFSEALRAYERAIDLWDAVPADDRPHDADPAAVYYEASLAAMVAGRSDRAVEFARVAVSLVDRSIDLERWSEMNARLGRACWVSGTMDEGLTILEATAAAVEGLEPSPTRARVAAQLAGAYMLRGDHVRAIAAAEVAVGIARSAGSPMAEAHALNTMGTSTVLIGRSEEGLRLTREAFDRTMALVDAYDDMGRAYANLSSVLLIAGLAEESLAIATKGVAWARSVGASGGYGRFIAGNAVDAAAQLGRWDEAETLLDELLASEAVGVTRLGLIAVAGPLLVRRGRLDAAEPLLRLGRSLVESLLEAQFSAQIYVGLVELELTAGRDDEASSVAAEGVERLLRTKDRFYVATLLAVAARAEANVAETARARRDPERAARAAATAASYARTAAGFISVTPGPDVFGGGLEASVATAHAEALRAEGSTDAEPWRAAIAAADRAASAWLIAYTRYRLTAVLVAARAPRREAQAALSDALAAANRLSAAPLVGWLTDLARRARLTVEEPEAAYEPAASEAAAAAAPEAARPDSSGLTTREREVLGLVADGYTNRRIAEALFISESTAGVHVSNILGKLGVATRTEAATVAARLGLVE